MVEEKEKGPKLKIVRHENASKSFKDSRTYDPWPKVSIRKEAGLATISFMVTQQLFLSISLHLVNRVVAR